MDTKKKMSSVSLQEIYSLFVKRVNQRDINNKCYGRSVHKAYGCIHNSWEGQGVGREMVLAMEVVPKDTLKKNKKEKWGRGADRG